jgi:hypothetical protein
MADGPAALFQGRVVLQIPAAVAVVAEITHLLDTAVLAALE